jgi:hypothetical protein
MEIQMILQYSQTPLHLTDALKGKRKEKKSDMIWIETNVGIMEIQMILSYSQILLQLTNALNRKRNIRKVN